MEDPGNAAPFADLDPERMLAAIESAGFRCDGRTLALNSYENRVYQIGIEDNTPVVAKFYRPGRWTDEAIGEEHTWSLALAELEIPVVAPLVVQGASLHVYDGYRFAVFSRQGGRWPELASSDDRRWIGRFIGRIHAVGAVQPFQHRPRIEIGRLGDEARDYLLASNWVPEHLEESYAAVTDYLLDAIVDAFESVETYREIRIHGDCHLGNVLWTDDGPHFVDLDDCQNGPAIQDLWMLLSGDRAERSVQMQDILEGYGEFHNIDLRELVLIEALRGLRMIHYASWVARRWSDPAFPRAFPWLEDNRYWEEHVLALQEQLAEVREPPIRVI